MESQARTAPQAASGPSEEPAGHARRSQYHLVHGLCHRHGPERTQAPRTECNRRQRPCRRGTEGGSLMPAERVIRYLEEIIWENGKPNNIRCDNGPEFISKNFKDWCKGNGINILYTQPGCPTQNSYIERFNGSYRRAVLNAYIFRTLDEVREQTDKWNNYYRVPLKIHFYEIVNNTSQYDVSVQALLEYGDISSPEEFVTQRWPIPPVLATSRSCSCSVLDNFTSPKQFLEVPYNNERPHDALGGIPPMKYRLAKKKD
jgi:transposase InsO family protein